MIVRSLVAAVLAVMLSGCAVADLVAHTVKAVENNLQDKGQGAAAPQTQATSSRSTADEPPPPAAAPAPRRSSVTVEELPAR